MAKKKTGGLINRLIVGSEKSEDYARASLPSNRWELFWDIFKSRFWKLMLINVLTLLFFLPLLAFLIFREIGVTNYGMVYPFSQGFGVGYLAPTGVNGYEEQIKLVICGLYNLLLPVVAIFGALGISGACYVIRNMVWTEGVFVANDFWKGIKQNFRQISIILFIFAILIYLSSLSIYALNWLSAVGSLANWLAILIKCLIILGIIIVSFMTCHMITFSVNYELKLRHLIKNSFVFTMSLVPHNVLMGIVCALPIGLGYIFISSLGGFMMFIGALLILFFGVSIPLLAWTNYTQWCFDTFVNPKVKNAKVGRGLYQKVKGEQSETERKYKLQHEYMPVSAFGLRPVKPITDDELKIEELQEGFSRKDIEKLNESKQRLYDDNEKYIEEHKNDERYLAAQSAEKQKEIERQKRIEQAKKELKKRKYNN